MSTGRPKIKRDNSTNDMFSLASRYNHKNGIPATSNEVCWAYFMFLMEEVGLNGPLKCKFRTFETDKDTFFQLAYKMHQTPFKAMLTFDDARAQDGKQLRGRFASFHSSYSDYSILDIYPCSFLEMMIALCQKYDSSNMLSEEHPFPRDNVWFWELMHNAKLDIYTDEMVDAALAEGVDSMKIIEKILETINNRTYNEDGSGGLFPLSFPDKDQRLDYMWRQMDRYMMENHEE